MMRQFVVVENGVVVAYTETFREYRYAVLYRTAPRSQPIVIWRSDYASAVTQGRLMSFKFPHVELQSALEVQRAYTLGEPFWGMSSQQHAEVLQLEQLWALPSPAQA